ncbi:MAG: hypothetical protein CBD88_07680 [Flavobacteriales bacterium TMED228]|nr:MAG: hypothetical protein CBD88_07680 [Flavobacteriales bacterium TMED228]|tara:strand:+ start:1161 stop:1607 length:447 start_codon:yes stop_codon:yes gene_type:complete
MPNEFKYVPKGFDYCKDISWDDVIKKISREYEVGTNKALLDERYAPTFVLMNGYFPGTIQKVYNEVSDREGVDEMHIYTSLGKGSPTFGKHNDTTDVLIVQSVGRMIYEVEDKKYDLYPGDGMYIPAGVYHAPFVLEPRITLSFAWSK